MSFFSSIMKRSSSSLSGRNKGSLLVTQRGREAFCVFILSLVWVCDLFSIWFFAGQDSTGLGKNLAHRALLRMLLLKVLNF